ncbi:U-box domain-containing protein 4 [Hordeum vulgare]|nr:U-box domain-containing protein 4 [Hordeum vulgare]
MVEVAAGAKDGGDEDGVLSFDETDKEEKDNTEAASDEFRPVGLSCCQNMNKGKEVVPPLDKGKEVVPPLVEVLVQDHPNAKRRNYMHYHEEARPTHFCKVMFAPKVEALPLPLDFTKHFPVVPIEFR